MIDVDIPEGALATRSQPYLVGLLFDGARWHVLADFLELLEVGESPRVQSLVGFDHVAVVFGYVRESEQVLVGHVAEDLHQRQVVAATQRAQDVELQPAAVEAARRADDRSIRAARFLCWFLRFRGCFRRRWFRKGLRV